jgi:hypothetical protein
MGGPLRLPESGSQPNPTGDNLGSKQFADKSPSRLSIKQL